MRRYTACEKHMNKTTKIVCNRCKKEIDVMNDIPREAVFSVEHRWDYFSEKDNEVHRFDLCEGCYDEWVRTFQIPVEVE